MNFSYDLIELTIMSLCDYENEKLANSVLEKIWSYGDCFIPKYFGINEPLTTKIPNGDFSKLVSTWMNTENNLRNDDYACGLLLAQKKGINGVSYSLSWEKSNYYHFNSFSMQASIKMLSERNTFAKYMSLCNELILLLEPAHGEIVNLSYPGSITPKNLRIRYPELNAVVIFGTPYIELFGRKKLLGAPCYNVIEIGNDVIALQLIEDIFNPVEDSTRDRLKEYLGKECFVETGKTYRNYSSGQVPSFDFANIAYDKGKAIQDYEIHKRMNQI